MKIKKILFLFIFLILLFITNQVSYASTRKSGIDNFPDSYKPYLLEIKKKHPNWSFTALYTNLDWKTVIDAENVFGKNLVPKSYSKSWKNTKTGEYNVEVDSGWVDGSRQALEYTMDSRNFLFEERLFQFEELSYNQNSNSLNGVEKILYGTEFYNTTVEYKNSSGKNITTNKKYSELILSAGTATKVSPYHLASRIKQEVGPFLSHSSISGTVTGYLGLFNFYNIGATHSAEPMGAIINGLKYAKDANGGSVTTKEKYQIPWNTKEISITGGGKFIGSSYINVGQDTIYLQKFDVNDARSSSLFWHQYMANVLAPYSESKIIYNGYSKANLLNDSMSFVIPVYNNMPSLASDSPDISSSDFTNDNTKVYANVTNTLNIRTGPGSSYEVLTTVTKQDVLTRIKKGKQSGDLWDKVKLPNGMVGYVFQSYLMEIPEVEISSMSISLAKTTINKGESIKLNIDILPQEAKNNNLVFKSSNTKISTVNSSGKITGIGSGKTTITVSSASGSISKNITINVRVPVTKVYINSGNVVLRESQTVKLDAIVFPTDSTNQKIKWSSSNTKVAKVTSSRKSYLFKKGNCNYYSYY